MTEATFSSIVASVITLVIVWWLTDRLRRKADLFWYVLPRASFQIPGRDNNEPPAPLHTEILVLQNLGRSTAEDIEIILSHRPRDWELRLVPNRPVRTETIAEGNFLISFGRLGPQEMAQVLVLYSAAAPSIIQIRTNDGIVFSGGNWRIIRSAPKWVEWIIIVLAAMGLFLVILVVVSALSIVGPYLADAIGMWFSKLIQS